jgi:hypothetical protein
MLIEKSAGGLLGGSFRISSHDTPSKGRKMECVCAFTLAVGLFFALGGRVLADDTSAKYGVDKIIVSTEEKAADQKYGGFPNNKDFNNDTKCTAIIALFEVPGIGPKNPRMAAFLTYSRVKLMELDLASPIIDHEPPVVDKLPELWKALPAVYARFCQEHPHETLENTSFAVYKAARVVASQHDGQYK